MSPFFFPMILPNMAAANVSRVIGAKGYNSTVTTACAASNQAIGEALEVVRRGTAEVMYTGGADAGISPAWIGRVCGYEGSKHPETKTLKRPAGPSTSNAMGSSR